MIPRVRQVDYSAFMHSYGSSGAICLVARVTWAAGEFSPMFSLSLSCFVSVLVNMFWLFLYQEYSVFRRFFSPLPGVLEINNLSIFSHSTC